MTKRLILIFALLLTSSAAIAQRVHKVNDRIYIDNRDLPAVAVSTTPKPRKSNATPTTDVVNSDHNQTDLASKWNNNTVSQYFQVASKDHYGYTTWVNAMNGCYNETTDGTGWRLPTHRELMLICVLQETIKAQRASFKALTDYAYWAATQRKSQESFLVKPEYYESYYALMEKAFGSVRCVKDVAPLN